MSGRGIAAFVLAAMLLPAAASAQERRTILDPLPESRPAAAAQVVAGGVPLSPQGLTQISEKALAFELRRIDFEIEMLRHAEAAFAWQAVASWLMMGLSIVLVLAGLFMSAYQFIAVAARAETRAAQAAAEAMTLRSQATATASAAAAVAGQPPPPDLSGITKLEISPTAIRVESSALGIIILVISLGFTYLFLDKVYELKMLSNAEPPPAAAAGSKSPAGKGG
jgi:hypothetical protein